MMRREIGEVEGPRQLKLGRQPSLYSPYNWHGNPSWRSNPKRGPFSQRPAGGSLAGCLTHQAAPHQKPPLSRQALLRHSPLEKRARSGLVLCGLGTRAPSEPSPADFPCGVVARSAVVGPRHTQRKLGVLGAYGARAPAPEQRWRWCVSRLPTGRNTGRLH